MTFFTSEREGEKEKNKNNGEEEEDVPSVVTIHVPQQQQYASVREEIEAKVPFVTRRSQSNSNQLQIRRFDQS